MRPRVISWPHTSLYIARPTCLGFVNGRAHAAEKGNSQRGTLTTAKTEAQAQLEAQAPTPLPVASAQSTRQDSNCNLNLPPIQSLIGRCIHRRPQAWRRDSCPASPPSHLAPSPSLSPHLPDHSRLQVDGYKKMSRRCLYGGLSVLSEEGQWLVCFPSYSSIPSLRIRRNLRLRRGMITCTTRLTG